MNQSIVIVTLRKLVSILTFFCSLSISFAQISVLSSGNWHKIGVTQPGMYKLDRAGLTNMGINVDALDPRTIKIYGNGIEGRLPQVNNENRPSDLLENAILVNGESDGSFDVMDYVLFYAFGPDMDRWITTGLQYEKNIYSDTAYYFVSTGGEEGKRIAEKGNLEGASTQIDRYDDHLAFEEDLTNILHSGRGWYGQLFSTSETMNHMHTIDGIASDIRFILSGVSQSHTTGTFSAFNNGALLGTVTINAIPSGPGAIYGIKGRQVADTFLVPQTGKLNLQISFRTNAVSGYGFLDFYLMFFKRNLQLYGNQTNFRTIENTGLMLEYKIGNASNTTIWNITDPSNVQNQVFVSSGSSASFKSQSSSVEEFVIFTGQDFPAPEFFGTVQNQNLRGETQLDGVIITKGTFYDEAERLAQFHREHGGLRIKVVTSFQVYNEFSSGRQDISAIRDYAKHLYDQGDLKYLLLFGDCSFDYKNREINNTNFVPTYESRDSFSPIFSHSSDDYFGFLEESEGEWVENKMGDHTLEVGIGRLPVRTNREARSMVDKIIHYSTDPATLGKWRNEIAYLGDDGDGNVHAQHVEELSELVDTTYQQYIIKKILLDAFTQEKQASFERSPETTDALLTTVKNGVLIITYIGHGNERLWTEEQILTKSLIRDLTNKDRLPIFITATCEFGRYDDPGRTSGAEELLLSSNGGAIALLTTSRPVFANTNFDLNKAFHMNIFRKADGQFQRLGDIIRNTKNEGLAGPINRNFTLLGDPMMIPAYPRASIVINELSSDIKTLSALQRITFTGEIQEDGNLIQHFNGRLVASIFDIEQSFQTKGQESVPYIYTTRNNALFRGEASVSQGRFSFSFIVPKNISYKFKQGKMSLYAWDENNNQDAAGSSVSFVMGGTNTNAPEDISPPEVNMYLNHESFRNGQTVGSSPLLIAHITDENGITTTSDGVIHGITLELNNKIFNLNEFYTTDLDSYTSGSVIYPIQNLAPGNYAAILKVLDTYSNATETRVNFVVSDKAFLSIFNELNYPNPARSMTTFSFEHDREEEDLSIQLLVYSSRGELVNKSQYLIENSERQIQIPWQPRTNSGQLLQQGIYFYRLIIQSNLDGASKEITNKIVIMD